MCWTALKRFYTATPIPITMESAPSKEDPLYKEIYDVQIDSLTSSTVDKMWDWQCAPDLDPAPHTYNPYAPSLGKRTLEDWENNVKPSLDNSKPVTLTLIAESNDRNAFDLGHHHMVIAYAYETRALDNNIGAVDILIYDPNCPNDDEVRLTFYTGQERHSIHLTHNREQRSDHFHGFFLNDADRNYALSDRTDVEIVQCVPNEIISLDRAMYDLQFKWSCRFIPYFVIQVDGTNWNYNDSRQDENAAKFKYNPVDADHKQCSTNNGFMTVPLELPRTRCKVSVRLLDADPFTTSIDVDAKPSFTCYPYVRKRADSDELIVCDSKIEDADLFIKVEYPTQAEVRQMDTSPFKWVKLELPGGGSKLSDTQDVLSRESIGPIDIKRLGNIIVPVFGNFVERNLAPPTTTSGFLWTTRNGQRVMRDLGPLSSLAQKIFDGFTDNPADYDGNTMVKLIYRSEDHFGTVASGEVYFFGQSIIYTEGATQISVWDLQGLKKVGSAIRKLTEMGLMIDVTELPHGGQSPVYSQIRAKIDQTINELWSNKAVWNDIRRRQLGISMQESRHKMLEINELAKSGETLATTNKIRDARKREYNDVIINTFAEHTIDRVRKKPKKPKHL